MKKIIALLLFLLAVSLLVAPSSAQNPSQFTPVPFASLGSPANGALRYCTNCQATSPCTSGGSGAVASRVAGAWNCTNGGASPSVAFPATAAQGDLLYGSAANTYSNLAKNTSATRYLSNTGTNNNPAWAQVALGTGVSGVLPAANNTVTVLDGSVAYCADGGSDDGYSCSLSPAPVAYVTGARYRFKANTANTGAATLNLNGLGAKTIKKAAGGVTTDLADNDIRAGQVVDVVYDGTNLQMQSTLGNAGGGLSGLTTGQYLVATGATTASTDGVKRYTALLSQSGTDAPTAVVLENSLGGTVVWARSSASAYTGTLVGAFTLNKTALIISNNDAAGSDSMNQYSLRRTSADVVTINTLNANWAGTEAPFDDGLLNGTTVEIRVYP